MKTLILIFTPILGLASRSQQVAEKLTTFFFARRFRTQDRRQHALPAGSGDTSPNQPRLTRWRRLVRPLAFLSLLGPGLIAANAGNDAGAVVTYSSDGAQYGYALLWMLVLVTISLCVVQEMCARLGAATGEGLAGLIRERFGVRGAVFAMFTQLVADALIIISEFAGIAAASQLLGIPIYLMVPLAAVGIWLVVTRSSSEQVEKIFLLMTLPFFAYPIAAVLGHPDWGQVARQTLVPSFHLTSTYLLLFVGTVGTTVTPYMQFYIQSSVAEKGAGMKHYARERADAYLGAIFADLIAACMIIATGATIFVASGGAGVPISDARQAAMALVPFLGQYAIPLFALGLLGASLLAAAVLPISTTYAFCESFGFERGVARSVREAPVFYGLFTGLLALGALVALIPGLSLVEVILFAQVINGILLPILLVFILRLVNDRRLMGRYTNSRFQNVVAWGTMLLLSALSLVLLASIFLPLVGVRFLS